jgi:hypothetical protein
MKTASTKSSVEKKCTVNPSVDATAKTTSSISIFPSRLAPHGKAPINIVLESFGYIHGAPQSQSQSWSPYSQPLPALDIRNVTDPVPSHLLFHDGLNSGILKRILKEQTVVINNNCNNNNNNNKNGDKEDELSPSIQYKNLQDYSRRFITNEWIFPKLVVAQIEGQHGYVNPVTMTIHIGSYLGRHRSVVVVEWVATELRKLLRHNHGGVITVPVSVQTMHRDVEKKIPTRVSFQNNNNKYRRKDNDDLDKESENDRV